MGRAMSNPESRGDPNEVDQAQKTFALQLAQRMRRAREYEQKFQHHTVWANERIARALIPNPLFRLPMGEDPLLARLPLDARLRTPPHLYGTSCLDTLNPPQLNPLERRPLNPNEIFYVSPDGTLKLTLGRLRNLGRPMLDEQWIRLLCSWSPMTHAHTMGLAGGSSGTVERVLDWLDKNTRVDRPDYSAACLDMYFAGVGVRKGILTPAGFCAAGKRSGQGYGLSQAQQTAYAAGGGILSDATAQELLGPKRCQGSANSPTATELFGMGGKIADQFQEFVGKLPTSVASGQAFPVSPLSGMSLSKEGRSFISANEGGDRANVYLDSAIPPNSTAGVGHLLTVEEQATYPVGATVPQELRSNWFEADLAEAQRAVRNLFTVPLSQNKFDALVDFAYQMGYGNLSRSNLLHNINSGNDTPEQVRLDFHGWNRGGPGVSARRDREIELYNRQTAP